MTILALPVWLIEGVLFYNVGYLALTTLGALLDRLRPLPAPLPAPCRRRFAVLIPAHDEADVLGPLLESLDRLDYPREAFQVFVVADNCRDATAEVARAHGALTFERRTEGNSTKGQALEALWKERGGFHGQDAIVLLDADNLVDPAFLAELDRSLEAGFQVAQGVRLAKNPTDSKASHLDTLAEALHNRINGPGRRFWGLSGLLAGSGVAFERNCFGMLIEAVSDSLVEDCEWQLRLMLAGVPIAFVPGARLYDEKIGNFQDLTTQRTRWIRGKILLVARYAWPLFREACKGRLEAMDGLSYLLTLLPRTLLAGGLVLGLALSFTPFRPSGLAAPAAWLVSWAIFVTYVIVGLALDGAPPSAYLALLWSPLFARHFLSACIQACTRRSVAWVATKHQSTKRIGDLD